MRPALRIILLATLIPTLFACASSPQAADEAEPAVPSPSGDATVGADAHVHEGGDSQEYTCAMHPQVRQAEAGTCPVCGMDLVVAQESAPESQSPQRAFLARFENAVNAHDWEALVSEIVDPGYVSQQHDDFLDGRTDQFISELFYPGLLEIDNEECQGYVRNATHAEKLAEIEDFTVDALDGQEIHYSFWTLKPECRFEGTLWLRIGDGDGETSYGVVGASG
jgi:hypothetical protein